MEDLIWVLRHLPFSYGRCIVFTSSALFGFSGSGCKYRKEGMALLHRYAIYYYSCFHSCLGGNITRLPGRSSSCCESLFLVEGTFRCNPSFTKWCVNNVNYEVLLSPLLRPGYITGGKGEQQSVNSQSNGVPAVKWIEPVTKISSSPSSRLTRFVKIGNYTPV